jgi:hypothetical protein
MKLPESKSLNFNKMGLGGRMRCNLSENIDVYKEYDGPTNIRVARETKGQLLPGADFANASFCFRFCGSMARWIL